MAESKGTQQKATTTGQRDLAYAGNPQSINKLKSSPYNQVLNPNYTAVATAGSTTISGVPNAHDNSNYSGAQTSHKRQLAQR